MRTRQNRKLKFKAKTKTRKVYSKKDYQSSDGMLTTVWGPSIWHFLHTMSFNYPVKPSKDDKVHYKEFIKSLRHILPCRHCRDNLKKNFEVHPIKDCHMKDRESFSRYVYGLHETVNRMLGKKSGLKYCDVRERYEHFRSRCTENEPKLWEFSKEKKEKGCTEPLYGKKSKCIIKIVPHDFECSTFQMDEQCVKKRGVP